MFHSFSKYVKLVEVIMVHVLGFVEDEHCFSLVSFLKNKMCNHLNQHLQLVVAMYADFYFYFIFIFLILGYIWNVITSSISPCSSQYVWALNHFFAFLPPHFHWVLEVNNWMWTWQQNFCHLLDFEEKYNFHSQKNCNWSYHSQSN